MSITDRRQMDELLNRYKDLVTDEVGSSLYLAGADRDDLIQEGMIGLMHAVSDFDDRKGASFESFARLCISRQIYKAIEAASRQKHTPLNSYISIYEDGMPESGEDRASLADRLCAQETASPETVVVGREETKSVLQSLLSVLSPMERDVLYLLVQEKNYREIAKLLEKSPKSVDNTISRLKKKLKIILKREAEK